MTGIELGMFQGASLTHLHKKAKQCEITHLSMRLAHIGHRSACQT